MNIEKRCSELHSLRMQEKLIAGFHSPSDCPNWIGSYYQLHGGQDERRMHCARCWIYMYEWGELRDTGRQGTYKNELRRFVDGS